jgi:meso-butanediol dehydrogenase / (S,S)-butanediol dehydrogenase / diacetyl reductase
MVPQLMGLLDGHKAIVTGGGSGIGRATCLRMAEEGARLCALDLDGDAAGATATEVGGDAFAVDVGDADALTETIRSAAARMDGLSIIYNNAGIGMLGPLHEYSPEMWDQIMRVNLNGVFYGIRAAAPIIKASGGGSIVSTASISGTRPAAGESAYSAAKAGIVALTAVAALEYAPDIRVNAVSPGMIGTKLTEPLSMFPDKWKEFLEKTPLRRIGDPLEIADVVVFLCSDLARFITGQNIVVDGGMTLHGSGVDGLLEYFLPFREAGS